jgi:tRNA dimethylallyltransferase
LSWWQAQAKSEGIMRPWYVRLTVPRAVLHERIERRVVEMLQGGWIDEVRELLASGLARNAPGLDAVGYRDVIRFLNGDVSEEKLAETIATATRRYAKRQETWFRHQLAGASVLTLDAVEGADVVARRVVEHWEAEGN